MPIRGHKTNHLTTNIICCTSFTSISIYKYINNVCHGSQPAEAVEGSQQETLHAFYLHISQNHRLKCRLTCNNKRQLTEVMITPLHRLSDSNLSSDMVRFVSISRFRLFTGFLFICSTAIPTFKTIKYRF